MKYILTILLLITNISLGQVKINLTESITGSYNTIKTGNQIILVINSQNHIDFINNTYLSPLHTYIDVNPLYTISYVGSNITSNELLSKEDFGYKLDNYSIFLVNQINTSLIRNINLDIWNGIGVGKKFNINSRLFTSLSYALLDESRKYNNLNVEYIKRNSVRCKIIGNYDNFNINFEYYYQPNMKFNDIDMFGSSTISIFPKKPISFVIQNVYNFMSSNKIKTIQSTTLGVKININK